MIHIKDNMSEKSASYPERLLLKPFLGLLPSWDIPSALAHHHLNRVESIDFDWIYLFPFPIFCIFSINFEI